MVKRDKESSYIKKVSLSRRYNNYKYLCTQYWSIYIYKNNTNRKKGKINSDIIIVGDFNAPL